jgi:hypothetical protein
MKMEVKALTKEQLRELNTLCIHLFAAQTNMEQAIFRLEKEGHTLHTYSAVEDALQQYTIGFNLLSSALSVEKNNLQYPPVPTERAELEDRFAKIEAKLNQLLPDESEGGLTD